MTTRSHEEQVGEEAIRAATGRSRAEWYTLLDDAGAREWDHARIARWLGGEHDVDGWWCQSVTVGYEQSRGMRQPGQQPDGSFAAGASKTVPGTAAHVWPHLAEDDLRREWLDVDWPAVGVTEPRSVRLLADDGTRITLRLDAVPPGRDAAPKVRVAAAHPGLADGGAVAETKKFWRDSLARLARILAR